MNEETLRALSQEHGADGSVTGSTFLSPTEDKTRGLMCVRPTTVVPVIFVPGIMGSNLRDAKTKESVWNTNSSVAILMQWIFRSAKARQSKLAADGAELDDRGAWYGKSATVSDEATGKRRGQGSTSHAFYGDFVRWLDDELNAEHKGKKTKHGLAADHVEFPSPWQSFVDGEHKDETWGAQKPFQTLSAKDSHNAWNNFFCPVHVQGYNWLKSNGDAGKALAKQIQEIIDYWNHQTVCGYRCEQVILVSHSMGGLVTRAAVHPEFGNVADKVLGIVHGEQPANGAAAAYHHCRSGYGGVSGLVLGRNAAQVTAVFANSPGAMELLPNHQYNDNGGRNGPNERRWLKVKQGVKTDPVMQLPESNPYKEIYLQKDAWWRLVDPNLIDPAEKQKKDAWVKFSANIGIVQKFHQTLGTYYHSKTYVHYGADAEKHAAYGDLLWQGESGVNLSQAELLELPRTQGSNPVRITSPTFRQTQRLDIIDPYSVGYPQSGDETVPACSGEAPYVQGGESVQQSFRLTGFEHQAAYNNADVRLCTLYSIGKLLAAVPLPRENTA